MAISAVIILIASGISYDDIFNVLNASADDSNADTKALNLYYFEKRDGNTTWLVAYKPAEGNNNTILIRNENYLNVSQGIVDRKYDGDISPELDIYIDSHGRQDLRLEFLLEFRYFKDQFLPSEPDVIISFNSYVTKGVESGLEHVNAKATEYSALPRDVPQKDYGAMFKLSIYLTGGSDGDSVDIYCGKNGYYSTLKTPYAKPYSSSGNSSIDQTACYLTAGIVIAVLAMMVIILHFRDWKKKSA